MKKIGSFLFLFLLFFACFMIPKDVFAENNSLNSVSVSSKSVKPGNQVRFTFNTTGDVSYITANWRLKDSYSGAGETFVISTAASGNSNSVNYTIPSEIKNGEYELSEVVLWRSDYTYDVIYAYNFDTTSSTITISGSTWDGNVSSQPITIKKVEELGHYCDTVENYCEFFIGVEFNSGSKVNYATIGSEKNSFNENMMQRAENYYISSIVISVPTYIYYVDTIEAYSYNYDTEFALEDVYSKAEIQLKMDNFIEDKVSPSLSSIQYHTNEVTAPGSFEFSLHVCDNYPEYSYSSRNNVSIKTENGDNVSNLMCSTEEDSEGWIYHCSVSFGKYTDVTGVYIDAIELEDAAGNLKTLSVDDGTITKKVIKVKSGGSLDEYIVIQNDSYDMTDMIHSLKDGDKVIFDLNYNSVVPKALFDQIKGKNIGLVDERSEIAAMYKGIPQNDVGIRTDVMNNCAKHIGMNMLIRSMGPQIIATDEIGGPKDEDAIQHATYSGIKLLLTAHGKDISDVSGNLIDNNIFNNIVVLTRRDKPGRIKNIYKLMEDNKYVTVC